jgi:hypothetical protein
MIGAASRFKRSFIGCTTSKKGFSNMFHQQLTQEQYLLVRSLLADVPDEEIIAYGTEQQIQDAFDGDIESTPDEKQASKEFVDAKMQRALEIGFQEFYWDLELLQYCIIF